MSQHTFEITGALLTTFLAGVVMPVSHEPNPHFMAIDLVVEREELEGRWRDAGKRRQSLCGHCGAA